MINEKDTSPQQPKKDDQPVALDYSNLRLPPGPGKFAYVAGRISVYIVIVQVLWALAIIPFLMLFGWKIIPTSEQWLCLFLLAWPALVGLAFGAYSVRTAGFNRRNIPGIVGFTFGLVVLLWIIVEVSFGSP
ncbi:MAG: hypothetical protein ABSB33_04720, partial [Tepidisphaeraceae bacterium]